MFFKTYILAFPVFSTVVETMLQTLTWSWNIPAPWWTLETLRHPRLFSRTWYQFSTIPPSELSKPSVSEGLGIKGLSTPRAILGCPNAAAFSHIQLWNQNTTLNELAVTVWVDIIQICHKTKSLWWLKPHFCGFKDEDRRTLNCYLSSWSLSSLTCGTVDFTTEQQVCHRARVRDASTATHRSAPNCLLLPQKHHPFFFKVFCLPSQSKNLHFETQKSPTAANQKLVFFASKPELEKHQIWAFKTS